MAVKKKPKKPPIDKKSVRTRLERARDEQLPVSVRRWIPDADRIDGYVVGIGTAWVAMAKQDGARLDGWCFLRLKDIQAVYVEPDTDCFEIKALKVRGEWPPKDPGIDLDSIVDLATSATATAPILSIHVEFDRSDICWEGTFLTVDAEKLRWLDVDPQAAWRRKPKSIDPEDITRIEFGGAYEEALGLVAGPPPAG